MEEKIYYTKEHEWVTVKGLTAYIGITDHAQSELGDIVFVDVPDMAKAVKAGDAVAAVESVKAASDIYSPVSGVISNINTDLADAPEKINEAAADTFIFAVDMSDPFELQDLLDEAAYLAFVEE